MADDSVQRVPFRLQLAHSPSWPHLRLHSLALPAVVARVEGAASHSSAQLPTGVHSRPMPSSEKVGELTMKSSWTADGDGFSATRVNATDGTAEAETFHIWKGVKAYSVRLRLPRCGS